MDLYYPGVFASKKARKSLVVITSLCSVYMLLLKLFVQAQLIMPHSAPLVQGQRAIWRLLWRSPSSPSPECKRLLSNVEIMTKSQDCWAWWLTVGMLPPFSNHASHKHHSPFSPQSLFLQTSCRGRGVLGSFMGQNSAPVSSSSSIGSPKRLCTFTTSLTLDERLQTSMICKSSTIPWYANPEVKDSSCISSKRFSLYLGLFLLLLSVFNMSENCRDVSKIGNPDREPWYPAGENIWHFRKLGRISF